MTRLFALTCLSLLLQGCIYSRTVEPLMTDYRNTQSRANRSSGDVKNVTFYVSVEWDKNGIGSIARKHGLEEIYYADIQITRILGFWEQRKVYAYGRQQNDIALAAGSGVQ